MKNQERSTKRDSYFINNTHFGTLLQKKQAHQKESWLNSMLIKKMRAMDNATGDLQLEAERLNNMVDGYKKKLAKENQKNIKLKAEYSILALKFLQDFHSDATAELHDTIRKHTKTFIYSALFENMAACEKCPTFKEFFKLSEGLDFDFWVTERLTQTFLRIQEYLQEAHGIHIESTHLPATELDLFENIRMQFSHHVLGFTPESIMIPFTGDDQDEIFKWHIDGCNYLLRRNYYKYAFKFGSYALGQMELIAQGMGLIRLSNLFARELRLLRLAAKDGGTKDKMVFAISTINLNVGEEKEQIAYWEKLGLRTEQAIMGIEGADTHALDKIEEEWLKKIVAYKDNPLPQGLVSIFCQLLKGHKKLIVNEKKRINLEGKYIHFFSKEENYDTVTYQEREAMIHGLKITNKEIETDLTYMKSSPDALFQVLKKHQEPEPESDAAREERIKAIESLLDIGSEESREDYVSSLLDFIKSRIGKVEMDKEEKEEGEGHDEDEEDFDDDDDDFEIDLGEFKYEQGGIDIGEEDDDDDDDVDDELEFDLEGYEDEDDDLDLDVDDDDDDDDDIDELEFDLEGYDDEEEDDNDGDDLDVDNEDDEEEDGDDEPGNKKGG